MNTLIANLGNALRDLVTSKKFLIGVMTAVVQALPISQDIKTSILGIGGALILGQAAADFGKNKAPVDANVMNVNELNQPAAPATPPTPPR